MTVLIALTPLASWAAEQIPVHVDARENRPASHVLFTGTDVQVRHQGALHPVRGVEGDAFIIRVNGRNVTIPMRFKPEELKVSQTLLLADRSAKVTNYKYDRAYTPGRDPVLKWSAAQNASSGLQEAAASAQAALANTPPTVMVEDSSAPRATLPMGGIGNRPDKAIANPLLPGMAAQALTTSNFISGNMGLTQTYADKIAEERALELFDALDVEFKVSSAKPIRNPYLIVTATYHEKDDPKYERKWLFAKALDPIEAEPSKIYVREAGFPPGFVVKDLSVHLYENGVEIATDLSQNRAELTREEAHEYAILDYLGTHKSDTKPPQIALRNLPEDWTSHRNDASLKQTYYVKVNKDGQLVGVFKDENCTIQAPDSYGVGILNDLLFVPALNKGKPVDGVLPITPAGVAL